MIQTLNDPFKPSKTTLCIVLDSDGDIILSDFVFQAQVLKEFEIEIPAVDDIPDELVNAQITLMRKKQQEERANAEVRCEQIEEKISRLLALEYKPETPARKPTPMPFEPPKPEDDDDIPF